MPSLDDDERIEVSWRLGRLECRPVPAIVNAGVLRTVLLAICGMASRLSLFGGAVAGVFLALIALVMGAEIVGRNLGWPLPFSWEYGAYLMSAAFFWGGGFTLLSAGHVRVTFLLSDIRPRLAHTLEILATAVAVVVLGAVAAALTEAAWQYASRGTTSFTTMQTPLAVPATLVAIGSAITWLQAVGRLCGLIAGRLDHFVLAGGMGQGEQA